MFCALNGATRTPAAGQQPAQAGDDVALAGVAGRAADHQAAVHDARSVASRLSARSVRAHAHGALCRGHRPAVRVRARRERRCERGRRARRRRSPARRHPAGAGASRRPGAHRDEDEVGVGRLGLEPVRREQRRQRHPELGDLCRPPPGRPPPAGRAGGRGQPVDRPPGLAARARSLSDARRPARARSPAGGPGRRTAWSASRRRPTRRSPRGPSPGGQRVERLVPHPAGPSRAAPAARSGCAGWTATVGPRRVRTAR